MSASPSLLRVTSLRGSESHTSLIRRITWMLGKWNIVRSSAVSRLAALPDVCLSPSERFPLQTNGRSHFPLESPPGYVSISTTHRTQAFSSTSPRAWVFRMDSPKGDCGRGEFGWVVGGTLQQNSPGPSSLQSLHSWEDDCASLSSWLSRGWATLKIPCVCVHIHIHTDTHKHTLSSIQTTGTKTAENTRQEQKSSIFKDNPSIFNVHLPQWNPAFSDAF